MGECLPGEASWAEADPLDLAKECSAKAEGGGFCCDAYWADEDDVEVGSPLKIPLVYPHLAAKGTGDSEHSGPEME